MLTIHLTVFIDAHTDEQSAIDISDHLKNLVWKEIYENLQMPATFASTSAERS